MSKSGTKQVGKIVEINELDNDIQDLVKKAVLAAQLSYSPYSKFKVGAALKCENGTIFSGCNIENIAYSPCICAERSAIAKAVSDGEKNFTHIAIAASNPDDFTAPCGVCRQSLVEFSNDIKIFLTKFKMDFVLCTTLDELLPLSFSPRSADLQNSN